MSKLYKLDYAKIKTVKDLVKVLKQADLAFLVDDENKFEEIQHLLVEVEVNENVVTEYE